MKRRTMLVWRACGPAGYRSRGLAAVAAFRAKYGFPVEFVRMDSSAVNLKIQNEYRAGRAVADAFTTSLGIESLIAPSLAFSLAINQSSSFVWRAEAMMATEPAGAFFSRSEISLSAVVQVDFCPRTSTSFKRSARG